MSLFFSVSVHFAVKIGLFVMLPRGFGRRRQATRPRAFFVVPRSMQMRGSLLLLLVLELASLVEAKKKEARNHEVKAPPLTSAELAHKRHFFSIGEGFEGTASDWTEYVVWLIGVIGVFYYMANPNARRNLHAIEGDYPLNGPAPDDDVLDDSEDDAVAVPSGGDGHRKTD